jgi:hypothetical protein
MLYERDYIPAHTHKSEDIFLTVKNDGNLYKRMKFAGKLANDSGGMSHPSPAEMFMQAALDAARANRRQSGTVYDTLDIIQAAAMLCVFYQEHVKECEQTA